MTYRCNPYNVNITNDHSYGFLLAGTLGRDGPWGQRMRSMETNVYRPRLLKFAFFAAPSPGLNKQLWAYQNKLNLSQQIPRYGG